jgi:hypothetical protein
MGSTSSVALQGFSHSFSVGHTRAHTPAKILLSLTVRMALRKSFVLIRRMNLTMSMPAGQFLLQGAS